MTRAYATIANDGKRDRRVVDGRPRRGSSRRSSSGRAGKVEGNDPVGRSPRSSPAEARDDHAASSRTSSQQGTGRRAQLAGHAEAGKTGTTDNYGDAWFVGYTPELVVAVWVGYPNELRPMLTEFHGQPVAGGTLPAADLEGVHDAARSPEPEPTSFDVAAVLPTYEELGSCAATASWRLDNGVLPRRRGSSRTSRARLPNATATCYANEVSVPVVIGRSARRRRARARSGPARRPTSSRPREAGEAAGPGR